MSQFYFTFSYQHQGSQTKELTILHFTGQEGISELFNFDLELKSDDIELDADGVVNQSCKIEVYYGDNTKPLRVIHGFINEFEDVNYFPDSTLYRAKVVPRVWQLGHFETNEVYLNENIQQTLTVMLEEAGFIDGYDFRFELSRTYRAWPFRLQYNETHLDYLQRIIEREGIYYYFEHTNDSDVMVFCDNIQALPKIEKSVQADNVVFQANSGVYVDSHANTINSIICKRHTLPKKVTLRDFNDETPSLDIRGEFVINSTGVGDINLYGLNIVSPEEGQELAEIHANAYLSHQKTYIGQGDVANMIVGHRFSLQDHPRDSFNQLNYLLEGIEHEGANLNQYQALHSDVAAPPNYTNSFSALSTEHEYAPKRQTVAPEINGTLNAVIDSEADSGYAELDDTGRYKVKLPFDRKDRNGGKASHWVRMMQPYGGANEGMHFPLRNNTRVLLGFIGGDPDRPFISGTINDSGEQQSIVTAENQTNNLIKTASGNKIELEDKDGKNRIKLQTGDDKTYMHLGAPNHDGSGFVMVTGGIERRDISGGQRVTVTTSSAFAQASSYAIGDIVFHASKYYECKAAVAAPIASATANTTPDADQTHWKDYEHVLPKTFSQGSPYYADDIVTYKGKSYKFKKPVSATPTPTDSWSKCQQSSQVPTTAALDDIVAVNGKAYRCINAIVTSSIITPGSDSVNWTEIATTRFNLSLSYAGGTVVVDYNEECYECTTAIPAPNTPDTATTLWDEYIRDTSLFPFHDMDANGTVSSSTALTNIQEVSGKYIIHRLSGKQYSWSEGNQFNYFATGADSSPSSDNKHFYFGNNWEVHCSRHAAVAGIKGPADLISAMAGFDLKGVLDYEKKPVAWLDTLKQGRVRVAQHDTFTAQNGNIFDFGGYWNYNLGNSYEENTISQNGTKVNRDDLPYDWCNKGGPHWTSLSPKVNENAATLAVTFDKTSAPTFLAGFFDKTNVEKTIDGHAYNYSNNTHSVDVSYKCNSINVSVAGESHEVKYSGKTNKKIYESKSGGGVSEEWKSTFEGDRTEYEKVDVSGKYSPGKVTETRVSTYENPVSYEIVREPAPGSKFSFKADALPTLEMSSSFEMGSNTASIKVSGMDNSVSIDGTLMKVSLDISGAVMSSKMELTVDGFDYKNKMPGMTTRTNIRNLETELDAATVKIESNTATAELLTKSSAQIINKLLVMEKTVTEMKTTQINLQVNVICLFC
ncbi:MAG: type VI secretion system VgrG family protein [Paraglaciecola sp.]|jgi:type VI secretion system VgrG family protein